MAGALVRIFQVKAQVGMTLLVHKDRCPALVVRLRMHIWCMVLRYLPLQKHLLL